MSPPSYTIKINNAFNAFNSNTVGVEEYSLRAYDKDALKQTKNVWLAEVKLRKVDNILIDLRNEISKMEARSNSILQNNVNYNENAIYKSSTAEIWAQKQKLVSILFNERPSAMEAMEYAMKAEDKATGGVPLNRSEMNKRINILKKWDMDPLKEVWAKAKEAYDDAIKKVDDVDLELNIENSKLAVSFIGDTDRIKITTNIDLLNNQKTINETALLKAHEAFIAATNAIPYNADIEKEIKKDKPPNPYRRRTQTNKNWTLMGGRNRITNKAHYYSKRRRTRHYRSKRVRSK
jgi:hypothetical protein